MLKGGLSIDTTTGTYITMELNGKEGNDTIKGYLGDDRLIGGGGGDGDDDLFGMGGTDRLTGGSGLDNFHFDSSSDIDYINDFKSGQDKIYIHTTENSVAISTYDLGDDLLVYTSETAFIMVGFDQTNLTASDFVISDTSIIY